MQSPRVRPRGRAAQRDNGGRPPRQTVTGELRRLVPPESNGVGAPRCEALRVTTGSIAPSLVGVVVASTPGAAASDPHLLALGLLVFAPTGRLFGSRVVPGAARRRRVGGGCRPRHARTLVAGLAGRRCRRLAAVAPVAWMELADRRLRLRPALLQLYSSLMRHTAPIRHKRWDLRSV